MAAGCASATGLPRGCGFPLLFTVSPAGNHRGLRLPSAQRMEIRSVYECHHRMCKRQLVFIRFGWLVGFWKTKIEELRVVKNETSVIL